MKLFYSVLIVLFCSGAMAQDLESKSELTPYVSLGISVGHVDPNDESIDNFSKASYPSFEVGIMGKHLSLGAVIGCENLFASSTSRGFYELKTALSKPFGKFGVYGLMGVGAYFERDFNTFIEYGGGFSYMPEKIGGFIQFSNWARSNYISMGVSYAF